ncbi:MAG: glycoside hydrolase family 15 protein, partial [Nitrospiria bacterium]
VHNNWQGYHNSRPVRSNNQAAEHVQNDVYGEMVLTLAPIFFDERFYDLRTKDHEDLLINLSEYCARSISQPDAGLWEVRNGWQEHSFANLMCWAGLERVQKIQELGYLKKLSLNVACEKSRAGKALLQAVVEGSLRNGPTDDSFDAALAQLPVLRFPNRELNEKTVSQIIQALSLDASASSGNEKSFFYRYLRGDDFGKPQSAFVICSFWMAQALVQLGRLEEAKQIMTGVITGANNLGLFSEHFLPSTRAQFGNFPQAYSHVGQINAAFAISPPWGAVW